MAERTYHAPVIRKIWFPEEALAPVGLPAQGQAMIGLGRLIVLAGMNGAGKSRYLQVLQELVGQTQAAHLEKVRLETQLSEQQKQPHGPGLHDAIVGGNITRLKGALERLSATLGFRTLPRIEATNLGAERIVTLTYQLAKGSIPRADSVTPIQAAGFAKGNVNPGFPTAHTSMHTYFAQIARALWTGEDARLKTQTNVLEEVAEAAAFARMLDLLVGGRIAPDLDENHVVVPLFRGRPFNPSELSDGEAVLVTWAIILHRQKHSLADSIVIIDEPENHLHPDACIKALRALRDDILGPHGQIWLATHSVQLIAFAGMDAVWWVDGGRIEYGGNKVDKVIERLLGGDDGRDQLRAFLADADALGFYKFAAECLVEPTVVTTKQNDPQEAQFVRLVRERLARSEPLRLLDFGAGKGRLAAALRETRALRENDGKAVKFSYYAFSGAQSPKTEIAECIERVAELGRAIGVQAEHVDDLRRLQLETSVKMDLVVLCNVLHEIRVDRWLSTFEIIASVLSPEGWLLLMEDQQMRIGELPTAHGFVVLDSIEVAALFGGTFGEDVREISGTHGGRLTQTEVSAWALTRRDPLVLARRDPLCDHEIPIAPARQRAPG